MSDKKRKIAVNDSKKLVKRVKLECVDEYSTGSTAAVNNEETARDEPQLTQHQKLADIEEIDLQVSSNLVELFKQDCTIPFIARYRKHLTNNMDADKLRQVKETIDSLIKVEVKAETLINKIAKEGPVDKCLRRSILAAKSLDEIEVIAAPFKKGSKGTLASRARQDGFEDCAMALLNGTDLIIPKNFVNPDKNEKQVTVGMQHVIADIVAKDAEILKLIDELKNVEPISLQCSEKKEKDPNDTGKYDNYKNFTQKIQLIKDHQTLAINRAEAQKVLTVKIVFPDSFWEKVRKACRVRWLTKGQMYPERKEIIEKAVDDAIHRFLTPLVTRQIRARLTKGAEQSAISVFLVNLKKLLLSPPIRGKVVLAIDPGISHGCKIAVVSPVGEPLDTGVVYLNKKNDRVYNEERIAKWIRTHGCEIIALGNGTFCRETEEFIAQMINHGKFRPFDVSYTIVDEQGVSHYSCSSAASEEFPKMDPNLISAVSLARRLQDPIAELVKVEPHHLGVGMYQHDLPEKKLNSALDEVVSECVSFVGVDLNTASTHLLCRVAGLTKSRANAIADYRVKNGPYHNREQILKVKGIGSKTFRQCGGFIKILPSTATAASKLTSQLNSLDQTEIHPEDYKLTKKLIEGFGLEVDDVGKPVFISQLSKIVAKLDYPSLSVKHNVPELQLKQILEALQKSAAYDLRSISDTPLFRRGITTPESLQIGQQLSGVVRNVVHFGAFVDIGVGISGLIHSSQLGYDKSSWVQLGDKVNVIVLSADIPNKRIGLRLA